MVSAYLCIMRTCLVYLVILHNPTCFKQCSQKIAGAPKNKSKADNIKIAEKALEALDKKFKVSFTLEFDSPLYITYTLHSD